MSPNITVFKTDNAGSSSAEWKALFSKQVIVNAPTPYGHTSATGIQFTPAVNEWMNTTGFHARIVNGIKKIVICFDDDVARALFEITFEI